jgi:hypothetical protein
MSTLYNHVCDFYLISLNLYEIQGFHGGEDDDDILGFGATYTRGRYENASTDESTWRQNPDKQRNYH